MSLTTHMVQTLQLAPRAFHQKIPLQTGILLIFLTLLGAACAPQNSRPAVGLWKYADLRLLDDYRQESDPGDFIAAYTRTAGSDFQIRLDLLEMSGIPALDFYVALDYKPGGSRSLPIDAQMELDWDTLLYLPSTGVPQALNAPPANTPDPTSWEDFTKLVRRDLVPRIIRLPWQDYVQISFNHLTLPELSKDIRLQVISTPAKAEAILDSIGPFSSKQPPPAKAPVLLVFWNALPTFSPAQSLRRWDGAHTGPFGERHGLSILLANVERYEVPITLLDLRTPFALPALDYLDAVSTVRQLHADQLLTLPDSYPGSPSFPLFPQGLPGWAPEEYLAYENQASQDFDLPGSPFLYSPVELDQVPQNYRLYFSPAETNLPAARQIPLPPQVSHQPQASPDGLSLEIRKTLIDLALQRAANPGEFPLLILGGDLSQSAFADPAASNASLAYIANHPWIMALDQDDLVSLPPDFDTQSPPGETYTSTVDGFSTSEVLTSFPEPGDFHGNPLYRAAWDQLLSIYATLPPEPDNLPQLRSNYSGQPGILLSAARWVQAPYSKRDCSVDLDLDGIPECILASEQQFAVIDLLGARLVAYFIKTADEVHQVIAPSSQFIVGLGDPSAWQLDAGEGADPAGIHGAFSDSPPPWPLYQFSILEGGIRFSSPDGQVTKVYSLVEGGLDVDYRDSIPVGGQIPVAIDPWRRISPNWSSHFSHEMIESGTRFILQDQLFIDLISTLPFEVQSFRDSQNSLSIPEDPNFDYPAGHYLPFPITAVNYSASGDFQFQFRLTSSSAE